MLSNIPRPLTVALAFTIWVSTSPQALAMSAQPTALLFQAVQGGANPPSQSVTVSKPNNKATNWTASDSATWVSASPQTGSITKTAQVTVSVNTAGLAAGTYSATVTVTAYKGGSVSIPVSLTVTSSTSLSTISGTSNSASLSWNPAATSGLVGYNVYVGTTPGVYGSSTNVGNVTSYVINNLPVGYTYYFVVTDYDSNGAESAPSNEVSKIIY